MNSRSEPIVATSCGGVQCSKPPDFPNGSSDDEIYIQAKKIVSNGCCWLLVVLALKGLTSFPGPGLNPGLTMADPWFGHSRTIPRSGHQHDGLQPERLQLQLVDPCCPVQGDPIWLR